MLRKLWLRGGYPDSFLASSLAASRQWRIAVHPSGSPDGPEGADGTLVPPLLTQVGEDTPLCL